jgi:hypothetical protein
MKAQYSTSIVDNAIVGGKVVAPQHYVVMELEEWIFCGLALVKVPCLVCTNIKN